MKLTPRQFLIKMFILEHFYTDAQECDGYDFASDLEYYYLT